MGIGATGGHADLTSFSPYLQFKEFSSVADGVDEIRKAVRLRVKGGPINQGYCDRGVHGRRVRRRASTLRNWMHSSQRPLCGEGRSPRMLRR
jgi:hypothetical protein